MGMRAKSRLSERGAWGPGGEGAVRWDFQNNGAYYDVLEVRQAHAHTVHKGARRRGVRPLGV